MSRRLKGFAALIAAAFATTAAMASISDIDSYSFRYDFSKGDKNFITTGQADIVGANAVAVEGPNGANSAVHVSNGAWKEIGSVLNADWTLAMSFRPGTLEGGVLLSMGRLNNSNTKQVAVCSSEDTSKLYVRVITRTGGTGTRKLEKSYELTDLGDVTKGFHTLVIVHKNATTSSKNTGTLTFYFDGVNKGGYTMTTACDFGNGLQFGKLLTVGTGYNDCKATDSDNNYAFYDVRFYTAQFDSNDATAYAAHFPCTYPFRPSAYVESSGYSAIDTGYLAKKNATRYVVDFLYLSPYGQSRIFIAEGDLISALYVQGEKATGNLGWSMNGKTWQGTGVSAGRLRRTAILDAVNKTVAVTNYAGRSNFYTKSAAMGTASTDATETTLLLAQRTSGGLPYWNNSKSRIYSFEIDENGAPQRFLVPATNDVGAAGLKDVLTGTFYGDANEEPARPLRFYNGVGCADDYKYEDDALYAKLYATSGEGGAVSIAGGAAAASAEGWIPRGGNLALVAVPAANMEFKEWIGDTWAIADGFSATDASIEVSTSYAVQLQATFKPAVNAMLTVPADGASAVSWSAADWRNAEDDSETISAPVDKEVTIVAHNSFTLTVDQTVSLSKLTVTGDVGCVVTLAPGNGSFLATEVVVKGGVFKLGGNNVLGKTPKVTVEDGGTIDMNGKTVGDGEAVTGNVVTEFHIAGAGAGSYPWALTSSANMSNSKNVGMLYLDADATIGGANALWIGVRDGAGWDQANKNMNLGGYTLTKTGSGSLTIRRPYSGTGGGTIDVQAGTLEVTGWTNASAAYGESCVSNIALVAREDTTAKNSLKYTLYFESLDVRGATMTSNSGAFGAWETFSGHGSMAKLAMADGATAVLDGNLAVSGELTASGALALTRAAGVETNVTVFAAGTLATTAGNAIAAGEGVILDIGANRPEGTIAVDAAGTLALRKSSITNEVIVLNASSQPQNIVVCDIDGATVIADPVVAYDAGVLTISVPTPRWSNIDGTGSFDSVENWSGNVPQPGESFIVDLSGDMAITLGGSLTPAEIRVVGSGTLAIFAGSHAFSESNVSAESGACYFVHAGTGEDAAIWIGGAAGNLGDAAKWLTGEVPGTGVNAIITSAAEATLTNSAAFKATSITFPSCSAAVTIDGDEAISGIAAVTNLSSASHTINVPVYFEGGINVMQNAIAYSTISQSHVTFAGGAYAANDATIDSGYSVAMFGKYYFANTSAWTATEKGDTTRKALADNSTLYIPYAGELTELYVGNGAKVDVGEVTMTAGGRLSWHNYGEIVVTNMTLSGNSDRHATYNQGTSIVSVFRFDSITTAMTGNWFYFSDANSACNSIFYIGAGGLNFSSATGVYCVGKNAAGESQTLRPWYSDFTIADRGNSTACFMLQRNVIFCTDDESGAGRTITMDAITSGRQTSPTVTVSGSGTLRVNKAAINSTQPTVTVTNTATLAMKPGANLTTSTTTVNGGATLAVAESGTVALGGGLTLADGAALGFNFTERATAPVLDLTDKSVTVNGTVNVKVSAADGIRPSSSRTHTLTSGYDFTGKTVNLVDPPEWVQSVGIDGSGNIVLTVKPVGLIIMFQ